MDIHILHGGIEIGPFSEETARTLLKQGSVLVTDMAWTPGLEEWIPLANLLYSETALASTETKAVEPAPVLAAVDPATAKQKAFLSYMGLAFDAQLSKERASQMVNDTLENPRDPKRLAKWNLDRLKLHPDLFSAEIQARKEGRSQRFLEICEDQGAEYFSKITKAHCQVLVGYLDVNHPNWDADEEDAAWGFFFPAVAEKFPQLLTKAAKGKFQYATGQKIAREHAVRSPATVKMRPSSSRSFAALARGAFFGVLILAMLWFAKTIADSKGKAVPSNAELERSKASEAGPMMTLVADNTPAATVPGTAASTSARPATNAFEATPAAPPAGTPSADMGNVSSTASTTAAAPSSNNIPLFNPDPVPAGNAASASSTPLAQLMSATPAARSIVLIKAVDVPAPYGKIQLPAGTPLKFIQRLGPLVKVSYLKNTFTLPATSTDIGDDPGPTASTAIVPSGTPLSAAPATVRPSLSPASDL